MKIKIYANYGKREILSEAEFGDLVDTLFDEKNDTPHFYTWLDNNYEASELWAFIGEEDLLHNMDKIRNTFTVELYEEVEHELLMYEGWEEVELEV